MNKDQLGYFLLVYRTGNIATAAAQVPMSTQGLGKSIRSLEAELGVPLFDIDANGGRVPTRYGEAFKAYAEHVDEEYEQVLAEFERIRMEQSRTIRLCSALGIEGFAGSRCVDAFRTSRPDVTVQMSELHDFACDELLRSGAADLGFTLAPFDEAFVTIPLHRERVFFWVNTANPLSQHDVLRAEDLEG